MITKKEAEKIIDILKKEYPDPACSLSYKDPLQLLIATRLAAQCTDARVNKVTPELFKRYKTADDFANANIDEVEGYIKSCGFYRIKAKDIVNMCKMLKDEYKGIVPDSIEELVKLPGVGRKTANLVVGDIYKKPAVVVDTHCMRITRKLGFHDSKNPEKIEKILKEILPENESNDFCHRLVLHGRAVCKAITPNCGKCSLASYCNEFISKNKTEG